MDELEEQKIKYAADNDLCPECCTELEYISTHERDSTYDYLQCPKCKWKVLYSHLEKYKK